MQGEGGARRWWFGDTIRFVSVVVTMHAAAALLLIVAGTAKVLKPTPTAQLLGSLGLPRTKSIVVSLGAGEVALGLLAIVVGGWPLAALTGVLYLTFFIVVWRALATGASTCGCFGRAEAPPSLIHLIGNAAFAAVSFASIAGPAPAQVMAEAPLGGLGVLIGAGVIAGLGLVAFTALPEALAARNSTQPPHTFTIYQRDKAS